MEWQYIFCSQLFGLTWSEVSDDDRKFEIEVIKQSISCWNGETEILCHNSSVNRNNGDDSLRIVNMEQTVIVVIMNNNNSIKVRLIMNGVSK